jgi:hypothetical protein
MFPAHLPPVPSAPKSLMTLREIDKNAPANAHLMERFELGRTSVALVATSVAHPSTVVLATSNGFLQLIDTSTGVFRLFVVQLDAGVFVELPPHCLAVDPTPGLVAAAAQPFGGSSGSLALGLGPGSRFAPPPMEVALVFSPSYSPLVVHASTLTGVCHELVALRARPSALSIDGDFAVAGDSSGEACAWRSGSYALLWRTALTAKRTTAAVTTILQHRETSFFALSNKTVIVCAVRTGAVIAVLPEAPASIAAIVPTPPFADAVVVATTSGALVTWAPPLRAVAGHGGAAGAALVATSLAANPAAIAGEQWQTLSVVASDLKIKCAALQNGFLAVGSADGRVALFDATRIGSGASPATAAAGRAALQRRQRTTLPQLVCMDLDQAIVHCGVGNDNHFTVVTVIGDVWRWPLEQVLPARTRRHHRAGEISDGAADDDGDAEGDEEDRDADAYDDDEDDGVVRRDGAAAAAGTLGSRAARRRSSSGAASAVSGTDADDIDDEDIDASGRRGATAGDDDDQRDDKGATRSSRGAAATPETTRSASAARRPSGAGRPPLFAAAAAPGAARRQSSEADQDIDLSVGADSDLAGIISPAAAARAAEAGRGDHRGGGSGGEWFDAARGGSGDEAARSGRPPACSARDQGRAAAPTTTTTIVVDDSDRDWERDLDASDAAPRPGRAPQPLPRADDAAGAASYSPTTVSPPNSDDHSPASDDFAGDPRRSRRSVAARAGAGGAPGSGVARQLTDDSVTTPGLFDAAAAGARAASANARRDGSGGPGTASSTGGSASATSRSRQVASTPATGGPTSSSASGSASTSTPGSTTTTTGSSSQRGSQLGDRSRRGHAATAAAANAAAELNENEEGDDGDETAAHDADVDTDRDPKVARRRVATFANGGAPVPSTDDGATTGDDAPGGAPARSSSSNNNATAAGVSAVRAAADAELGALTRGRRMAPEAADAILARARRIVEQTGSVTVAAGNADASARTMASASAHALARPVPQISTLLAQAARGVHPAVAATPLEMAADSASLDPNAPPPPSVVVLQREDLAEFDLQAFADSHRTLVAALEHKHAIKLPAYRKGDVAFYADGLASSAAAPTAALLQDADGSDVGDEEERDDEDAPVFGDAGRAAVKRIGEARRQSPHSVSSAARNGGATFAARAERRDVSPHRRPGSGTLLQRLDENAGGAAAGGMVAPAQRRACRSPSPTALPVTALPAGHDDLMPASSRKPLARRVDPVFELQRRIAGPQLHDHLCSDLLEPPPATTVFFVDAVRLAGEPKSLVLPLPLPSTPLAF